MNLPAYNQKMIADRRDLTIVNRSVWRYIIKGINGKETVLRFHSENAGNL